MGQRLVGLELAAVDLWHAMDVAAHRDAIDAAECYVHPTPNHPLYTLNCTPRNETEMQSFAQSMAAMPWMRVRMIGRYRVTRHDFRTDRDFHGITIVGHMKDAVHLKLWHDFIR